MDQWVGKRFASAGRSKQAMILAHGGSCGGLELKSTARTLAWICKLLIYRTLFGAPGMIRTCDLLVRRLTQERILLTCLGRGKTK
jgi:hypothetical protein